jgi:hypothetical protein
VTIFYKIRNKNTGMFSKGGMRKSSTDDVEWSRQGKTWDTLGKLRSHLNQHLNYDGSKGSYYKATDMSHWEVVEYHVTEAEAKGIHEVLAAKTIVKMLTR